MNPLTVTFIYKYSCDKCMMRYDTFNFQVNPVRIVLNARVKA